MALILLISNKEQGSAEGSDDNLVEIIKVPQVVSKMMKSAVTPNRTVEIINPINDRLEFLNATAED